MAKTRKFYNNEVLCRAIGVEPKAIAQFSRRIGQSGMTVRKVLSGSPDVQLGKLMQIVEGSGADYGKVFDPKFYRANAPEVPESN